MVMSREIRLKSHPVGMPTSENFELATVSVSDPRPGEVQVKNLWMSVDPYMRGRMVARANPVPAFRVSETFQWDTKGENAASNSVMYGWRPPFQLGEALQGGAVGEVAASSDPAFSLEISSSRHLAGANGSTRQPKPCGSSIHSGCHPRRSSVLQA